MPDQPDDQYDPPNSTLRGIRADHRNSPASRKRTAVPSAPPSPTSPSAENENKRAKLLNPAHNPTPNAPTDGTTTNSADQKPDAGSTTKEAAAAHPPTSEPGAKDTAAAVTGDAPVEPDSTAVAVAVNEAAADEAMSHSDDAVPESRAFTYRTSVVDCPLSPGEMAELRAYYALDAERRAEERARALAEYEDEDEDDDEEEEEEEEEEEGGGRPASSPTAEG